MIARIGSLRKATGFKFELTIHPTPNNWNPVQTYRFISKKEAKAKAKELNAQAYNY